MEVLLDEVGVFEMGENKDEEEREEVVVRGRKSREQRWGAVDVEDGGRRLVDAMR